MIRNFSKENIAQEVKTKIASRPYTVQKRVQKSDKYLDKGSTKIGSYIYSQRDLLGRGYSSKVYKASHFQKEGQKYAIKVIDLHKFNKQKQSLFENQIKVNESLFHSNIVRCFDTYKTQKFYYIVTEYCSGGDLSQFMKKNKIINEKKAIEIIKQIIQGYRYLIKRGVIHRDIKPANIFKAGTSWKIGDFGFSTFCKGEYILDSMSIGTPLYMAPQSLRSMKYSNKTDIFAIGVMAYEMLFGKTPWESKTESQILQKMKTTKLTLPNSIKDDKLAQFLHKACELDQFQRMNKSNIGIVFETRSQKQKNQVVQKTIHPKKQSIDTSHSSGESTLSLNDLQKLNPKKLKNQLNFCKHIHTMIKNISCFLLQKNKKQTLLAMLFKHLLSSIKILANQKFQQKFQQQDRLSEQYNGIVSNIKSYVKKYESQYEDYLKITQIPLIRGINQKFPKLFQTKELNNDFYPTLKESISNFLIAMVNEIKRKGKYYSLPKHYQSLESLYSYYEIINHKQDKQKYGYFLNQLKITNDFTKSKLAYEHFEKIRDKIKLI